MSAAFRSDATFTITGRGLAVSGEIMDGVVMVGMIAEIPGWPKVLRIDGVELIRNLDRPNINVGLLFRSDDPAEFIRWRTLQVKGKTIAIREKKGYRQPR